MKEKTFQIDIEGKPLQIEIKDWACQASGSCLVKYGETEVLATAVMAKDAFGDKDFFPLTVDYEERFYAAGRIFGSRFIRRESRPTDAAILTGRMIDRSIRPVFPEYFKKEVQVIITCLSWDAENDPDILGLMAASVALSISDIPWQGPIAGLRLGRVNGKWVFNPTYKQRDEGDLDFVLTAIEKGEKILLNMMELGAKEVSEDEVLEATKMAEPKLKELIEFQKKIQKEIGKEKIEVVVPFDAHFEKEIKEFLGQKLERVFAKSEAKEKNLLGLDEVQEELIIFVNEKYPAQNKIESALAIFEKETERAMHKNILENNKRPDNRKPEELRDISCEVGVLPITHGSGLFHRGLTKTLSILTLGTPRDHQLLEGMEFVGKKRFLHHYNFPPYCSGEIRPLRGPKRREIGHGCLVEKALIPLIPDFEKFPYTIRVVSEILSSNGSTSMASVSSASLALMDAGVPIKEPAAGISIGMVHNEDWSKYKLLTDIQGPEDQYGDMDFKIAGTKNGITAIQMDVKIGGITQKIIKEALSRAKEARLEILKIMEKTIAGPRPNLAPLAPKIYTLRINPEKIGEVVGPRGSIINKIIAECNVTIDIEDDGLVYVSAKDEEAGQKAMDWIKTLTKEVEIGETYEGKVKRILEFGAFVEILPGQTGLVHISKFVPYRIKSVEEVVKIGETIPVKVVSIDEQGRINLSAMEAGFKPKK